MKNLKSIILVATLSFSAFAQVEDPMAEQIRLTQDSVSIAISELENSATLQSSRSHDGDLKLAATNAAITAALRNFEERVRMRILIPLQMLVSQYNRTYSSSNLPEREKRSVLESLRQQITTMVKAKEKDYFEEVVRLHAPIGQLPVGATVTKNGGTYGFNGFFTANLSRTPITFVGFPRYTDSSLAYEAFNASASVMNFMTENHMSVVAVLSLGCYTSTCYLQTLNQATMWTSLIRASLARDLHVTLADGTPFTIKPKFEVVEFEGNWTQQKHLIASGILQQATTPEVVVSLPVDIRPDRLATLKRIESTINVNDFNERNCQRAMRPLKDTLCRSTDGCLSLAEKSILMIRLTIPFREACLNY